MVIKKTKIVKRGKLDFVKISYSSSSPQSINIIERLDGNIRSGSLEYFFDHVLPPMKPGFGVDHIYDSCIKEKILTKRRGSKEYTWKGVRKNLKGVKAHKTRFINIFRAVTGVAQRDTSRSTSPNVTPTCFGILDDDSEMGPGGSEDNDQDSVIYLESTFENKSDVSEERRLCATSFGFHFKSSKEGTYDNIQRVLHRLTTTMHIDPCRRFVLGATIEDTSMRLWFCNRSMVITSEQFDINRETKILIRLILCLAFAENVDMGWDPTIRSEYRGNERLFDIELCGKLYKTVSSNILSQRREDSISSFGTRVYKAYRADDVEEKEHLIIKDYWPPDYSETEDIRQKKMLDEITDSSERELVERTLLTPISCERVKVGDREDHTKETILRGVCPDGAYKVVLPYEQGDTGTFLSLRPDSFIDLVEEPILVTDPSLGGKVNKKIYVNRWHHRIAYKEVATPYKDLRNLKDMALVLEHVIQALRVIHKAGWVHRDLSVGNLYLYVDPVSGEKRGLIGDFECAKKVGSGGRYDLGMGTPSFMSAEILAESYLYEKDAPLSKTESEIPQSLVDKEYGFWANYLHDLESVWWIVVWTITHFQKASDFELRSQAYELEREQKSLVNKKIFSVFEGYLERQKFLSDERTFNYYISRFQNSFPAIRHISRVMRSRLMFTYYKREYDLDETVPILVSDEYLLHDNFLEVLRSHPCEDIEIVPIEEPPLNNSNTIPYSKRSMGEEVAIGKGMGNDAENRDGQVVGIQAGTGIRDITDKKRKRGDLLSPGQYTKGRIEDEEGVEDHKAEDGKGSEAIVDDEGVITSQRVGNKRKRRELTHDVDNEASRPITRSRVAPLDTNRRVTRSMTKAMLNAKSLGDKGKATEANVRVCLRKKVRNRRK